MSVLRWNAPPYAIGGEEVADYAGARYRVRRIRPGARHWRAEARRGQAAVQLLANNLKTKDEAKAACERIAAGEET